MCELTKNGLLDPLCSPFEASNTLTASKVFDVSGTSIPTLTQVNSIARYLRKGFWDDNAYGPATLGFADRDVIRIDVSSLSADAKKLALTGMSYWSEIIDRDYVVTTRDADITFTDDHSADPSEPYEAYTSMNFRYDGQVDSALIQITPAWLLAAGNKVGTYGYQTYVHEIGHALGLGHAGLYNGTADYDRNAKFSMDSWQTSIMSYFRQSDNHATRASDANLTTPMLADLIAVREIYNTDASDVTARSGNTIYGNNTNAGEVYGVQGTSYMVVDGGGYDQLNYRDSIYSQRIDLRGGQYSSVSGEVDNIAIAYGSEIEMAVGGEHDDRLDGNYLNNRLLAHGGDDHVYGRGGNDFIRGFYGDDLLKGGKGADRIVGNYGRDIIFGERGDDILSGENGSDKISGNRGLDRLFGGAGNDALSGGFGSDWIAGQRGSDRIFGGEGNDRIYGGSGSDYIYSGKGTDTVDGGQGNDHIYAGGGADVLHGGAGADHFYFARNTGGDRIRDFNADEDDIVFLGTLKRSDVTLEKLNGDNWKLDIDDGGHVVLVGLDEAPDLGSILEFA
ncbi:M10 family metallopeptidase [Paracoccaceae bacterium GXU_MW_L88]